MKNIQYVASDLDGTLLTNGARTLPQELFDVILKLRERGIHFIVASGRQYASLEKMFEPVKNDVLFIAENGSLCLERGHVIFRGHFPRETGLRIIKAIREYPTCSTFLSCESRCYTDSKDPEFIHQLRDVLKNEYEIIDDLCHVTEPFLKLAFYDTGGSNYLYRPLNKLFEGEIKFVTSGNFWLDAVSPDANKGSALSSVLDYLNLDPARGIAFGDQYNDVELLQTAGISYAMSGCAPGIMDYADHSTDSVLDVLKSLLEES